MLILSRKVGERVLIGENIWIMVTEIDRNKVKIGIDAPDGVPIVREELIAGVESIFNAITGKGE